ncbi:MAG: fatty acid--CoA ligase family protein [Marinisporobacter sp.]|jgi:acyl-coenzyme A synthetase/AMP-(fatty) acid ligase|nr:fatty acid--CoA ligase family protein [Marinisporobacter sp.]
MDLQWLFDKFDQYQGREAIVWKNKVYTYDWLISKIKEWKKLIIEKNITKGQIVTVEGDYSPSISALFIALIENDNIIVPLSSASEENKREFLEIANVSIGINFDEQDNWKIIDYGYKIENEVIKQLINKKDPGLVLFSSGSTGKSKGALLNFRKILKKYKKEQKTLRTLVFLLIDHIGGINTLFYILSNGGTMIVEGSKDPSDICKAIERYKVELLPTSPTFINLLLISEEYKKYNLSSLKLITYGTEPMQKYTLENANEIFQNVKFKQTYGLSELGIVATKSENNTSLWMKLGGAGYQYKIKDNTLWIKAESAMEGYLNAPSPFDEEGWFNTQDVVLQKGDYFRILGRESEIINVGGQKVYPAEVESVILEVDNIQDVIVRGEKNIIMGNIVCAKVNLVELEPIASVKKKIRKYCKEKLEAYKIPVKIEIDNDHLYNKRFKRMRRKGIKTNTNTE